MSTEPTTPTARRVFLGPSSKFMRGMEQRREWLTAIEAEAREQGAREAQEALARLRGAIETEWYNGNMDEPARDRLLDEPT